MYRCPDCGYVGPIIIETDEAIPSEQSEADDKE